MFLYLLILIISLDHSGALRSTNENSGALMRPHEYGAYVLMSAPEGSEATLMTAHKGS